MSADRVSHDHSKSNTSGSSTPTLRPSSLMSDSDINSNTLELSSSGGSSLSSRLPQYILERLTPLKRRMSDRSPQTPSPVIKSREPAASPPRSRLVPVDEVLKRAERQKLEDKEKREQKKIELRKKQLSAEKIRKNIIAKRSENAAKFLRNKLVFSSHKVKFRDIVETHGDEGDDQVLLQDEDDHSKFYIPSLNPTVSEITEIKTALKTIKKACKRKKTVIYMQCLLNHPILAINPNQKEHHNLVSKSWEHIRNLIFGKDVKYLIIQIVNSFELPHYREPPKHVSSYESIVEALYIFWNYHSYKQKLSCGKNPDREDDVLSVNLGPEAKKIYQGYELPGFLDLRYHDDNFSNYILQKVVDASEIFLKKFKVVLGFSKIPKRSNVQRLEFFKEFKNFTNLLYLFRDDHSKKLFLLHMKVQDNLISALAIQEHIQSPSVSCYEEYTPLSEINRTTATLKALKGRSGKYLSRIKRSLVEHNLIYETKRFRWISCGLKIKESRSRLLQEFDEDVELYLTVGRRITIPFGFKPLEWLDYQFEKLNESYDRRYRGLSANSVPRSLKTGRRTKPGIAEMFINRRNNDKTLPYKYALLQNMQYNDPNYLRKSVEMFLVHLVENRSHCNYSREEREKYTYGKPTQSWTINGFFFEKATRVIKADIKSIEDLKEYSLDTLTFALFCYLISSYEYYFSPTNLIETELIKLLTSIKSHNWMLNDWEAKNFDGAFLFKLVKVAWERIVSIQFYNADLAVNALVRRQFGGFLDKDLDYFTYLAFHMRKDDQFLALHDYSHRETENLKHSLRDMKENSMDIFPMISFKEQDHKQKIIEFHLKVITARTIHIYRSEFISDHPVSAISVIQEQLISLVKRLRIFIQTVFVQYAIKIFFQTCPLLTLGKKQHFGKNERMWILSPGSVTISGRLFDYFNTQGVNDAGYIVEGKTLSDVVEIVKDLASVKIRDTESLASIFDNGDGILQYDRKAVLADFLQKNITENKYLKDCISKSNLSQGIRKRVLFLVFKSVGYEMDYENHDSTRFFVGKLQGIADQLMYEFKRLIDLNIEIYDDFFEKACAHLE